MIQVEPQRNSGGVISPARSGEEPLFVEGGVYSREQVLRVLGVTSDVLDKMESEGLRSLRYGHGPQCLFLGRHLVEFLRSY